MMPLAQNIQELSSTFAREGYIVLPGIVSKPKLADLAHKLRSEFARAKEKGELFSGGGTITGHLNCFPGAESRFVYEELEQQGVFDLIRKLSPAAERMPNVGCNMNLPKSSSQNSHVDGYAATPFIIVNVAAVDTDISNGATEIVPGTHTRDYKYWQYALSGKPAIRLKGSAGDVSIRLSSVWHRGMPNKTDAARPMLAFTWENGGSELADPYTAHGGKITFLTNRYGQNLSSRVRERAFATMPALGTGYLFMRSIFQ
jgi:hypothetical protein